MAKKIASDVEKNVQAAQAAEAQRLDAEKAAAEQQAAAAAAELERQSELVTCPYCGGVGKIESGDGRYVCRFCGGTGTVTRAKAATYNPADWRDYLIYPGPRFRVLMR